MYIESIILKNCKVFKEVNINLQTGLNLIQGKNSSGKSSLLKIIYWILWGSRRNINNILRRGENELEATIIYVNNNIKYKVTKKYNKKYDSFNFNFYKYKNKSWINIVDSSKGSKQTQLRNMIEKTTGLKESLFDSLLYFKQKKFYSIIYGGLSVKQFLDYILNITHILYLKDIIKEIENEFKINIENEDLIRQQYNDTIKLITELNTELDDCTIKINNYKKEINEIIDSNNNIESLYNLINTTNDLLTNTISNYQQMINYETQINNLKLELNYFKNQNGTLKTLISKKVSLKQKQKNIISKITELNNLIQNKIISKSELNTNINNANEIIKNIESFNTPGKGICPVCRQIVGKEHIINEKNKQLNEIKNWQDKLNTINNEIENFNNDLKNLELEKKSIEQALFSIPNNILQIKSYYISIWNNLFNYYNISISFKDYLNNFLANYKNLIEKYNSVINDYNKKVTFPIAQQPNIIVQNPIFKDVNSYSIINSYYNEFNNLQTNIKAQYIAIQSKIQDKQNILSEYISNKSSLQTKLGVASETKNRLETKLNNIEIIRKNKEIYIYIKNVFNKIAQKLRNIRIDFLERQTYSWYKQLVSDPQFKAIKIDPENYSILINPNDLPDNKFVNLTDNLSGGNETLLAIAERLALIHNIDNPIILLDETTDGTDSDNISSEIKGLASISNLFPQIILITHHKIGSQFANKIIRLNKNETKNLTTITDI